MEDAPPGTQTEPIKFSIQEEVQMMEVTCVEDITKPKEIYQVLSSTNAPVIDLNVSVGAPALPPKTDLDSVFTRLEDTIVTFVKSQLKRFQLALNSNQPEDLETLSEDEEAAYGTGEELRKSKEAFVKITQYFLKSMNEENLADSLQKELAICQHQLKSNLRKKYQHLFDSTLEEGNPVHLNHIYTELSINEKWNVDVNYEHEVRQIETAVRETRPEIEIKCDDIFKALPGSDTHSRTVMTFGVSGIGKTVSTHKFILDWADDKVNQDIEFIFPFTFRELNLLKTKKYSLVTLLHDFFRETKEAGICRFDHFKVLFIFDGLDECQLPLDFCNSAIVTDVTETTSVDILLTNLIRGKLLPSAQLWIITRPSAVNLIPPHFVDMSTEVRGFSDSQKEEYFRKRFREEATASKIISHIKTSPTLNIICHIPLFCKIAATVFENMLKTNQSQELPKTLTVFFIHFLSFQSKLIHFRYHRRDENYTVWNTDTKKMILSLGKLAFEMLKRGNLIFYEEDLKKYGIDTRAASVYSGLCTQIFKSNEKLFCKKLFCFVHLSVQEFLAALYVLLKFNNFGVNLLSRTQETLRFKKPKPADLYKSAVNKALECPHGHLDLFLRFLLGLLQETNRTLLQGLLKPRQSSSETIKETVQYIKEKLMENLPLEKSINLLHCLNEMDDHSLVDDIQRRWSSEAFLTDRLTPAHWSALNFVLLSSEKDLTVFDLKKYGASEESLLRLLPVVQASNTSLLNDCKLTKRSCETLASVLSSPSCNMRELDLSNNDLEDSGVKMLAEGLKSPYCRLETLRLSGCRATEEGFAALASALTSNPSHLRELDLSNNHPGEYGLELLSAGLRDPRWRLEILRVDSDADKTFSVKKSSSEVLQAHGSVMDSSDWTELEPKVNTVDEVETYSLQSDAGHFECRVSALRWVCKKRVSFKYQFCSWEEHRERPSCTNYMPAGPLLDITVTSGELEEVHLPHWICIDDDPTNSDVFAVLHVDTCGDFVEQVAEVTSSHVKLVRPVFSPRGAMIWRKLGFSVKVYYDVLIYRTIKAALTLHVYLLPPDPVLQQVVEREETSDGSKRIRKPNPNKSLLMENHVFLSADTHTAEICPEKLKLTSERRNPNFFEVFIRNAKGDFALKLEGEQKRSNEKDTVWTCTIRTDDYQSSSSYHVRGQHFVDRHRTALINRVSDTGAILDELEDRGLISDESYNAVRALKTTQDQMRDILKFLNSTKAKDGLYEIMKGMKHLRPLISELEGTW